MATIDSPLRYPGGKTALYPLVNNLLSVNEINNATYIEPFAGGCGLALKLLFNNDVSNIIINDVDPAIYSFWYCVLNRTEELCERVEFAELSIPEWDRQKEIYCAQGSGDLLAYGFSTLFLNRTNISGVLKGGIIGGRDQTGRFKMDARFNKVEIIKKIKRISESKSKIKLYNLNAIDFIYDVIYNQDNTFTNFDPPYVCKGANLYTNFYTAEDHIELGKIINRMDGNWLVTYDDCALIRSIYQNRQRALVPVKYSAGRTKSTKEIAVFSDSIILPNTIQKL